MSSYKLLDNERKVDAILDEIDDYFSKLPEGFIEEVTTFDSDDATEIVILILKKILWESALMTGNMNTGL